MEAKDIYLTAQQIKVMEKKMVEESIISGWKKFIQEKNFLIFICQSKYDIVRESFSKRGFGVSLIQQDCKVSGYNWASFNKDKEWPELNQKDLLLISLPIVQLYNSIFKLYGEVKYNHLVFLQDVLCPASKDTEFIRINRENKENRNSPTVYETCLFVNIYFISSNII